MSFSLWCSSRLTRSHSTSSNLDSADVEFRRGGVRATAGPRLGWSRQPKHRCVPPLWTGLTYQNQPWTTCLYVCPLSGVDVPFSRWSRDEVCAWLQDQGLGLFVDQAQSWLQSGQTLLQASQHDLEKVGRPRWSWQNLRAPFK